MLYDSTYTVFPEKTNLFTESRSMMVLGWVWGVQMGLRQLFELVEMENWVVVIVALLHKFTENCQIVSLQWVNFTLRVSIKLFQRGNKRTDQAKVW